MIKYTTLLPLRDNDKTCLWHKHKTFQNRMLTRFKAYTYEGKTRGYWTMEGGEVAVDVCCKYTYMGTAADKPRIIAFLKEFKRGTTQECLYFEAQPAELELV